MLFMKLLGSVFVLIGSTLYGFSKNQEQFMRTRIGKEFRYVLIKMEHMLLVERKSIEELTEKMAEELNNPWKMFFEKLSLSIAKEKNLRKAFQKTFLEFEKTYKIEKQEKQLYQMLLEVLVSYDAKEIEEKCDYLKREQSLVAADAMEKMKKTKKLAVIGSLSIGCTCILMLL